MKSTLTLIAVCAAGITLSACSSTDKIDLSPVADTFNQYAKSQSAKSNDDKSSSDNGKLSAASNSDGNKAAGSGPKFINIDNQTYLNTGNSGGSGSGFNYDGSWYARQNEFHQGTKFVQGNQNLGGGFWQNSKYWVPEGSSQAGGEVPELITINDQTYAKSGRGRQGGSGFEYGGYWYRRDNSQGSGTRFVQGNQSQGGGFWQDSKYWVRQ